MLFVRAYYIRPGRAAHAPTVEGEGQVMRKFIYGTLIKIRNAVSKGFTKAYPTTDWEPEIPKNLEELSTFVRDHYKWTEDPVYGYLDHIKPIKHMNLLLKDNDLIKGDCDDLATYTAYTLGRMAYSRVYRVNILSHFHVVCVFKHVNHYKYVNNRKLVDGNFNSIRAAAQHCAEDRDEGREPRKLRHYSERIKKT